MAKSSASLVGAGTPARRPAASRQPAFRADEATLRLVLQALKPYQPPSDQRRRDPGGRGRVVGVSYAELHCHSNASFLDGGSHPEELAEEAARLGLEALAITDHDGMYGIVRFAEAARALSSRPSSGPSSPCALGGSGSRWARTGDPDPAGEHLVVLARGPEGARAAVPGHLGGADGRVKGAPGRAGAAGRAARRALGGPGPGAGRGRCRALL